MDADHYQHSGAHGALGLQMLAQSCHPPPQFPVGHKRAATDSASTSRAGSPTAIPSPLAGVVVNNMGVGSSGLGPLPNLPDHGQPPTGDERNGYGAV